MKKLFTYKLTKKRAKLGLRKAVISILILLTLFNYYSNLFVKVVNAQEVDGVSTNSAQTTNNELTELEQIQEKQYGESSNLQEEIKKADIKEEKSKDKNDIKPSSDYNIADTSAVKFTPIHFKNLSRKNFRGNEPIEIEVANAKGRRVNISITNARGKKVKANIEERIDEKTKTFSIAPPPELTPGEFTIEVSDSSGNKTTQDFTWGVLAINPNKSIYKASESAQMAIAVLDYKGDMVCDADVNLQIESPNGKTTTLSTENKSVHINPQCNSKDLSLAPDYEAQYKLEEVGEYKLILAAKTKDGIYSITDKIQAQNSVPFDISRIAPTRIYPVHTYPVQIQIEAEQDFKGTITEEVPAHFTISEGEGGISYDDIKTLEQRDVLAQNVLGAAVKLAKPFDGKHEITSGFGENLDDPLVQKKYEQYHLDGHDGIDFEMPEGTEVLAAEDGVVALTEKDGDYGTTVVLEHQWGKTYYGHLSEIKVKEGDQVHRGEIIALSGSTGLSTAAHLHFGVKPNENDPNNGYYGKVDPSAYLGLSSVEEKVLGIEETEQVKVISWDVDVKKGDRFTLAYQYKTPNESPQFYTTGPLKLIDREDVIVYSENRQWQIAVDASNYVGRHVKTVEYSFGNSYSGTTNSLQDLYATDNGVGSADGWTTTAPTQADDGIDVVLNGTNIEVIDAFIEFTATATGAASLTDMDINMSTCPVTVATCTNAPVYRALPLFGNPATIFYYVNSGEINKFSLKANAEGGFDGVDDLEWLNGVETILKVTSTGPGLSLQTAKLVLTYESDFITSTHDEIKTVRFPLDADTSGDTGSKRTALAAAATETYTYNANIPDLDGNGDILDVWFEISAEITAASSNGTVTARVVSGSPTDSPAFDTITSTGVTSDFYGFFRPGISANEFQPNTSQQLRLAPATNAIYAAGGELVVTYRFSTDEASQTDTIRYYANQLTTSGSTSKNTATFAPAIANTGASVVGIWARVQAANTAASTNLQVYGDIDSGGATSEKSNTYTLAFTGGETIGQPRIIYNMTADAASFSSGGNMTVSTQWSAANGDPPSIELFITFTWSGSSGGAQTKSIQYYMDNSKYGGTAATTAQVMRSTLIRLEMPETVTKTLRSAYVENYVVSSDTTSPVDINMGVNESAITSGGTGFIRYVNTGEGMSFSTLEDISSYVDVTQSSQRLNFNFIADATAAFSAKAILTYDVDYSGTGTAVPAKQIKTIEYSFGNSNVSAIASATTVYATGSATVINAWSTTAPTQADQGILVKINGTNIVVKQAWVELTAQTTAAGSMTDMDIALSTCQGSVSTCSNAPVYRDLPLLGSPATISYFINSGETNILSVKANAVAAFDGLSDSDWSTGVETIARVVATGPSLNGHTAKLVLTYESDYDVAAHNEVKTVRFPLDSTNSTDTGSRQAQVTAGNSNTFNYTANIPDLTSNSDIYDVYFELYGQTGSSTGNIRAQISSGSPTNSPNYVTLGAATATTQGNYFIFRPSIGTNNFEPNTAQQLIVTVITAAANGLGGELVITYKYSTGAASQTETIKYFADQRTASADGAKNTATIAPVISNSGFSISNIYARVTAYPFAASSMQVYGDIDNGGATSEKSNTFALQFASEIISPSVLIYEMTADAASFSSGGNMTVSTDWSNTSGGPPSVEVYITYTWDGSGGAQTKTVEYYIDNSKFGGTAAGTAQEQRSVGINLIFPESVDKTVRSAYVATWIVSSDTTTPVIVNQDINQDFIANNGTGSVSSTTSREDLTIFQLLNIASDINIASPSQVLIFNHNVDATNSFTSKAVVTYDANQPLGNTTPDTPTLTTVPFNNEETSDITPNFEFEGTDTDGDSLIYQIQIDDTYSFASVVIDCASSGCTTGSGTFTNTEDGGDTSPFTEDQKIRFAPSTTLSNGATYYWRVRVNDGAADSSWSTIYSITIDTGLTVSQWFQTTDEQFDTGTLSNTQTTGSDSVEASPTSSGITVDQTDWSSIFFGVTNLGIGFSSTPDDNDIIYLVYTQTAAGPATRTWPSGFTELFSGGGSGSFISVAWKRASSESSGNYDLNLGDSADNNQVLLGITYKGAATTGDPNETIGTVEDGFGSPLDVSSINTLSNEAFHIIFVGSSDTQGTPTATGYTLDAQQDPFFRISVLSKEITTAGATGTVSLSGISPFSNSFNSISLKPKYDLPGSIMSPAIDFDWVTGQSQWNQFDWSENESNGSISLQLYYRSSSDCDTIVPDVALANNSTGFSAGPIDISGLNTTTYNRICLKATLTYSGGSPFLEDWTVKWGAGGGAETPTLAQLMRHGKWFNASGVRQPFTF